MKIRNPKRSTANRPPATWIIGSALFGSTAGIPWVVVLSGPLMSALLGTLGAVAAVHVWPMQRLPAWSVMLAYGTVGFIMFTCVGFPLNSTWSPWCLSLVDDPRMCAGAGLVGLVVVPLVVLAIWSLGQRVRNHIIHSRTRSISRVLIGVIALAGVPWSLVNELLHTGWGESPPCAPDIGWVAVIAYVSATVTLVTGLLRKSVRRHTELAADVPCPAERGEGVAPRSAQGSRRRKASSLPRMALGVVLFVSSGSQIVRSGEIRIGRPTECKCYAPWRDWSLSSAHGLIM